MFGSNFIELGLAVSFLFLLLSLMCSLLGETFSKYLSWRAEMLEESIRQLLRDPKLADAFYRHPMIKSLARHGRPFDQARRLDAMSGDRWPRSWVRWLNRKLDLVTKPSYIKSTIFARVALETIALMPRLQGIDALRVKIAERKAFADDADRASVLKQLLECEFDTQAGFQDKVISISACIEDRVSDEDARGGLIKCVEVLKADAAPEAAPAEGAAAAAKELDGIRAAIGKLENIEARRIFQSIVSGGSVRDKAHAEALIARYYDDVQERVSGWYKRQSQRWVFLIGLALALILNANTFIIADKLLRDNSVRAMIVAAAEGSRDRFKPPADAAPGATASATPGAGPASRAPGTPSGDPTVAANPSAAGSSAANSAQGDPSASASMAQLQELKREIDMLSLPIGWPERPLMVATPVLPAAADCIMDAIRARAADPNAADPPAFALKASVRRVDEDTEKRAAQVAKDAKAMTEFEQNPRGCPDFVCGDRKWGTDWPYYLKKSVLWFLKMAIGWLATALGAALGAQFWFDLLGNIMHIRASKKPEDASAPAKTT